MRNRGGTCLVYIDRYCGNVDQDLSIDTKQDPPSFSLDSACNPHVLMRVNRRQCDICISQVIADFLADQLGDFLLHSSAGYFER